MNRRQLSALCTALATASCYGGPAPEDFGQTGQQAVFGPTDDRQIVTSIAYPYSAMGLVTSGGRCTGTLIAPDKVLTAQPDHRRARQIKGVILFYREKFDESKVMLEEALALNPNPELAHYYLGRICEKQGDQPGAMAHYREALRRFIHEPSTPSPTPEPVKPADPAKPK